MSKCHHTNFTVTMYLMSINNIIFSTSPVCQNGHPRKGITELAKQYYKGKVELAFLHTRRRRTSPLAFLAF
jgi:hypothetical protein